MQLHVDSPEAVSIEREDTGEVVCTSPCNKSVPATTRYRIGGKSVRASKPFELDATKSDVKIKVDPGTNRGYWTGIAVLGAGGALAIAGGVTMAVGQANRESVPGPDGTTTELGFTNTMFVGTTLIVAGICAGIWGGAKVLGEKESTVTGNVVKPPPARGDAPRPQQAAWISVPTYSLPIIGGTF